MYTDLPALDRALADPHVRALVATRTAAEALLLGANTPFRARRAQRFLDRANDLLTAALDRAYAAETR